MPEPPELPLTVAVRQAKHDTEAGLIEACKRGDLRAFEQVYAGHSGRMKSIAFHLLSNRSDAEDAVQDAFLRIHRAIGGFQGQSGLAAWMYRILINCCYDAGRKRQRHAEVELASEPVAPGSVPMQVALRRALERIHSQHRMVFWLFEVEGFKHSEIGGILEIPEGTSKKWLFEAKRELKRSLMEVRS